MEKSRVKMGLVLLNTGNGKGTSTFGVAAEGVSAYPAEVTAQKVIFMVSGIPMVVK